MMSNPYFYDAGGHRLGNRCTHYLQGLKLIFGVVEVEEVIVIGFLIVVPVLEFDDVVTLVAAPTFP